MRVTTIYVLLLTACALSAHASEQSRPNVRARPSQAVVLQVLPPPVDPEKAAQEQRESVERAQIDRQLVAYTGDLVRWTKCLAFFTLALAGAAVIQIGMFLRQLGIMRQDLADAKTTAEAARDSANAARDSVEVEKLSMTASDRAYVQHPGIQWRSHPTDDRGLIWRLHPRWLNAGNTPARNLRIAIAFEIRDEPYGEDFAFPLDLGSAPPETLAPKSELFTGPFDISAADLLLVKGGQRNVYVWGLAEYRDVYPGTPLRITKMCVKAVLITGDPMQAWNDQSNPLDIRWAHVARQNYMDDDRELFAGSA